MAELYKKGISIETIEKMVDNNIRSELISSLSDQDFAELGIKKIGDKIMIK